MKKNSKESNLKREIYHVLHRNMIRKIVYDYENHQTDSAYVLMYPLKNISAQLESLFQREFEKLSDTNAL